MALPILPLIIVAIWIARALGDSSGKGGGGGGEHRPPPLVPLFRVTNLLRFVTWIVAIAFFHASMSDPWPMDPDIAWFLAALTVFNLPAQSSWVAARVLPARVAWYVVWFLMPRWISAAPSAGASLAVLRGRAARGPVKLELLDWLEAMADTRSQPLPLTLVLHASIAQVYGDHARCRALMECAASMPAVLGTRSARRLATDWLMADAAADGDWARLVRIGSAFPTGASRGHRPGHAVAGLVEAALAGQPLARSFGSIGVLRPLLAWRLRKLVPILHAAREIEEARNDPPEPLSALARHRDLLARRHPDAEALGELGQAWDTERAGHPEDPFWSGVEADLVPVLRATGLPPGELGPTLEGARTRVLAEERARLDDQMSDLARAEQPGSPVDEIGLWLLWHALRCRVDRILGLSDPFEAHHIINSRFHGILSFGARLHNNRGQSLLCRTIMCWQLERARGVCSDHLVKVIEDNIRLRL